MNKVSPKGIVEPTKMRKLCDKIRELLSDNPSDRNREKLQGYTQLQRCFTKAEAESIHWLYYLNKREKEIIAKRKGK